MSTYQIIGAIWLINTIVISVVLTDMNDSSKCSSFITKFVNNHNIVFCICFIISIIISIWLLQIEVQ